MENSRYLWFSYNIYDHEEYYPGEPVNIHIQSLINIIQDKNWVITTKNGKGKLPLFCGNAKRVIPIYASKPPSDIQSHPSYPWSDMLLPLSLLGVDIESVRSKYHQICSVALFFLAICDHVEKNFLDARPMNTKPYRWNYTEYTNEIAYTYSTLHK